MEFDAPHIHCSWLKYSTEDNRICEKIDFKMPKSGRKSFGSQHVEFDTTAKLEVSQNRRFDSLELHILYVGKIGRAERLLRKHDFFHAKQMQNERIGLAQFGRNSQDFASVRIFDPKIASRKLHCFGFLCSLARTEIRNGESRWR